MAILIGSEHCGHQIGASTCDGRVCRWAVVHSDAAKSGIGPMFWRSSARRKRPRLPSKQRWWKAFASNIPITIFSRNDMCDLSPHNRPLEHFKDSSLHTQGPGLVNSDFLYLCET